MLLYVSRVTPRLSYITGFIAGEIFPEGISLTTNHAEFEAFTGPKCYYGNDNLWPGSFRISCVDLLFERSIVPQHMDCFVLNGFTAFFRTTGDDLGFDLLAASFYLLSRYEEYLPGEKDAYGRFDHTRSLAYNHTFLHRPLVNEWLAYFMATLAKRYPQVQFTKNKFRYLPTYDIDIAWSYLHKGFRRNAGGFLRAAVKGNWKEIRERWQVLGGKASDPFDSYKWLDALHSRYRLSACYFFLVAARQKGYDKNIPPSRKAFQELVKAHTTCELGIHPSWQSGDDEELLPAEINRLRSLSGKPVLHSRQHYIRFDLPGTYRSLLDAGIREDFSMGYGTINGFRASVASPFYWYDLPREQQTNLRLYPFCFMDANAYYEEKISADASYRQLIAFYERISNVDGMMITIFHNNFLGTGKEFTGWREIYEKWMQFLMDKENPSL